MNQFLAYTSLMGLGEWMQNLIERVKYFTTWASTCQQPTLIWLGAFTFPKGFLTSILQVRKPLHYIINLNL